MTRYWYEEGRALSKAAQIRDRGASSRYWFEERQILNEAAHIQRKREFEKLGERIDEWERG